MPTAQDYIKHVLYTRFNSTKNALHSVAPDINGNLYTGAPTEPFGYREGIYLPDCEFVYGQLDPGVVPSMQNNMVAIYVGPVSGGDYGLPTFSANKNRNQIPMAARLLFRKASQEPVLLPNQANRHATQSEITQWRTQFYLSALIQTIQKYGGGVDQVSTITPDNFMPLTAQVSEIDAHGDLSISTVGEAFYLFTVTQDIIVPCHENL